MSQEELAEKVFVSRQTISNWENDKSYPDVQSLSLIADLFGTSIDRLVKGDLPMIDARIKEEEARAAGADLKVLKRNTAMASVLAVVSMVVAIVALDHENWLALAMCLLVYGVAIYFTFLVEGVKKKYDIQTYREVSAFMGGVSLDEIREQRASKPSGVSVVWKVLVGMCIGGATGLLVEWLIHMF